MHISKSSRLAAIAVLAGTSVATSTVCAQAYPEKAVRFVVGYAPGGATDMSGRFVADKVSAGLGQQVIVDNRPGAGSLLATELVARAAPDGYTILLANATVAMPELFPNLKFDMVKDLKPVSMLGYSNLVLTVHPSMPVRSVGELIALAKRRPNEMNYATAGTGSFIHLALELLVSMTGMKMVHVPYKGGAPSAMATITGETQVSMGGIGSSLPHIEQGRLRPLAVSGATRHPSLPNVPSMDEAGVKGYAAPSWYGLFAPAKTPDAIVAKLSGEVRKALADPTVQERFTRIGVDPAQGGLPEIEKYYAAEVAKWTRVIRGAGVAL